MIRPKLVGFLSILSACLIAASVPAWAQTPVAFSQLVSKLHWRSIGPAIGGRVVAVSGVIQQPNVFYMGAVDGGIWKSDDYGVSWNNISDKSLYSSNISIGAIAVAPSDPEVIYAGTGEADIRNDFVTGNGIYKSTDAGGTWRYIGLGSTHTTSKIVVDPRNPNVVYVASLGHVFVPNGEGGVYKTSDGGQTWKKVLFVNDETGAIDLAMDPQNPEIMYAAMWQVYRTPWKLSSGGPGSGLYKTTDGGANWVNISHGQGLPQGILARIGVAVAPSQPNIVYAIVQAKHGGVFRSEDAGQTWTRVNRDWALRQRGFYYSTIYVNPKDPNTVYMPEVDALWVSHNGGKKITKLHTPHGDNHIAWINPNNPQIILEGNDGGATVTVNAGKTWSGEHDQPTGQFYHVNLDDQFPFHVYGAQQDEGSIEGPSAVPGGGIPLSAWSGVAGGESSWVVPQPGKPWITYASDYYVLFQKENRKIDLSEGVSPWPDYQSGAASDELKYRLAWIHPILFSPADPGELLVGAQCVLKSMDYGDTWNCISPDLTHNDKSTEGSTGGPIMLDESAAEVYPYISSLAVSPHDGNVIWAGSSDGLVHVTTNGGQHWSDVTPSQLTGWGSVSSIAPSYSDIGTAYLTVNRYMWDDFKPYVFKTTDYGKHWANITQDLPEDEYVMSVCIDSHNKNLVFLGTRNSVYVSVDGGNNWEPLGLNLPNVQVRDVAIQPDQNSVVIATHGRAFWVLDNLALLEQLADEVKVASNSAYLFTPQLTWMTVSYGSRHFGEPSPAIGENHQFGTSVFFHLPADYNGTTPATLEFTTAAGAMVNSYHLHPQKKGEKGEKGEEKATVVSAGMNRFQWDLRYPGSSKINGFYSPPEATNGYDPDRPGPEIVPGTYYAILHYGNQTQRTSFDVTQDPRLTTTQSELQARQKLLFEIQSTLNELNASVNQALVYQGKLERATKTGSQENARYQTMLSNLQQAIGVLVQMNMHSSEGDVTVEPALRGRLAALFSIVDQAYVGPRKLDYEVYDSLKGQIRTGLDGLRTVEQRAHQLLPK
ncbi:MAG: glycosyl hydrolase [Gammaproteobacteria bacterium]